MTRSTRIPKFPNFGQASSNGNRLACILTLVLCEGWYVLFIEFRIGYMTWPLRSAWYWGRHNVSKVNARKPRLSGTKYIRPILFVLVATYVVSLVIIKGRHLRCDNFHVQAALGISVVRPFPVFRFLVDFMAGITASACSDFIFCRSYTHLKTRRHARAVSLHRRCIGSDCKNHSKNLRAVYCTYIDNWYEDEFDWVRVFVQRNQSLTTPLTPPRLKKNCMEHRRSCGGVPNSMSSRGHVWLVYAAMGLLPYSYCRASTYQEILTV